MPASTSQNSTQRFAGDAEFHANRVTQMRSFIAISRLFLSIVLLSFFSLGKAQEIHEQPFNPADMERMSVQSQTCTGFYKTPSWSCAPVTIPIYVLKAQDRKAMVIISHGSQGLDKRHSDYAKELVANGINAVVVGHWQGRGLGKIQFNYEQARKLGGDVQNQVIDVMATTSQLKAMPEWANTKVGHIGESMGGGTALALTRPYLYRIYAQEFGQPPVKVDSIVALYAGCTERNTIEVFLPIPLLFISGGDDDDTLASDCEKEVPWMKGRGGNASIIVLPGEYHDFDSPYPARRAAGVQNPQKCASLRDGDTFTLEATGRQYPGTYDGYVAMRKDCLGLTWHGPMSGNRGNPRTGYPEWTAFFTQKLLQ